MPKVELPKERPLCPPGLHRLRLAEVIEKDVPAFDGEGSVRKWIWRFLSNKKTPEGTLYEVAKFTGTVYGNSKAALTWLLDMMIPGITQTQADNLDTDVLIGTEYEASIKHVPSQKDPSKKYAEIQFLKPLQDPPTTLPLEVADPFADE